MVIISSFKVIDLYNSTFFNNKSIQVYGITFFFIGIMSYFHFILLEPFVLVYLSIIAVFFYYAVTINFSPFYQPNYHGFLLSMQDSFWDKNTQNFISGFYQTQSFDVTILVLVILLIIQFILVLANTKQIFPVPKNSSIKNFLDHEFLLDSLNTNKILQISAFFILFQYFIAVIYLLNRSLLLTCFLFLVIIPIYKKRSISVNIAKIYFFPIKIYDLYFVNFALITYVAYILGLNFQLNLLIYIYLLWFFTNLVKLLNIAKNKNIDQSNNQLTFKINIYSGLYLVYLITFVLYLSAWLLSSNEEFFLSLFLVSTLLRYNNYLKTRILQISFLSYFLRQLLKLITYFAIIVILIFSIIRIFFNSNLLDLFSGITLPVTLQQNYGSELTQKYGALNTPYYIQCFNWFCRFLLGALGQSIPFLSVGTLLARIIPTLEITILPFILAIAVFFLIERYKNDSSMPIVNKIINKITFLFRTTPIFIVCIFLITFFSNLNLIPFTRRNLLPTIDKNSFYYSKAYFHGLNFDYSFIFQNKKIFILKFPSIALDKFIAWSKYDWFFHMLIPTVVVGLFTLSMLSNLYHKTVPKILSSEYIISERASGFDEKTILRKFVMKNSVLSIYDQFKRILILIFVIDPLIEIILIWPGIGYLTIVVLLQFMFSILISCVLIFSLLILFFSLIIDCIKYLIDPTFEDDKSDKKTTNSLLQNICKI